jgi:phosphatidylserine decarboxylase
VTQPPTGEPSPIERWVLFGFGIPLGIFGASALVGALFLGVPWLYALPFAVPFLIVSGFLIWFFRDPDRAPGEGIVSPADGHVSLLGREEGRLRIGVFMNVTDVHVNRFPLDAEVVWVGDGGRGHAPASAAHSRGNVQREYRLKTSIGEVTLIQITGILARRLVSFVKAGHSGSKGDRLGMIVLGSRVDVLLPEDRVDAAVRIGDRVYAGVTTIARVRP